MDSQIPRQYPPSDTLTISPPYLFKDAILLTSSPYNKTGLSEKLFPDPVLAVQGFLAVLGLGTAVQGLSGLDTTRLSEVLDKGGWMLLSLEELLSRLLLVLICLELKLRWFSRWELEVERAVVPG